MHSAKKMFPTRRPHPAGLTARAKDQTTQTKDGDQLAEAIEWILSVPGQGFVPFTSLPEATRYELQRSFQRCHLAGNKVDGHRYTAGEGRRHDHYARLLDPTNRAKTMQTGKCLNTLLYLRSKDPMKVSGGDNSACDACTRKPAPCVRMKQCEDGHYRLCFFPLSEALRRNAVYTDVVF